MNILRVVTVGLFISSLAACGSDSDNNSEKKQGAIPEYQMNALDKANNTEAVLLESEQKRKKQIEEQSL